MRVAARARDHWTTAGPARHVGQQPGDGAHVRLRETSRRVPTDRIEERALSPLLVQRVLGGDVLGEVACAVGGAGCSLLNLGGRGKYGDTEKLEGLSFFTSDIFFFGAPRVFERVCVPTISPCGHGREPWGSVGGRACVGGLQ